MNRTIDELWTLGCSEDVQQAIHAAKELFKLELQEREKTPVHDAAFFREAGEVKSKSTADNILLKRLAVLRQQMNIENLSRTEYSKRKRLIQKRYVGDPVRDAQTRVRAIEFELSQGLPRNSKNENLFLDQILLSNNHFALTNVQHAREKITDPLLLQQLSSAVAIATEHSATLQPVVARKAKAFTEKLKSGNFDRAKLLSEICETPFCNKSFRDFAHQVLGLADAEEELKGIYEQEYSYLEPGSWPYLFLSGHDVLRALEKIKPNEDDVLTEVGCGLGINAIFAGLTTGMRIDGFDINPDWVKLANKTCSRHWPSRY